MTSEKKPIKVLLVDDDKFLLDMYALKFKKGGLDVNTAVGSPDALNKLHEGFTPDILLMDLVMPGMDGLELLQEIKKQHLADAAIYIILTNQGQQSDIDRAKAIGVHGYIVKASTIPSEVLEEVMKIYHENKK